MPLKKGVGLIAIGFLFISFHINIDLRGGVLTLPPEFVGWILFVLAYPKIVEYTSFRVSLYWIPFILAACSAINWTLGLLNYALFLPLITIALGILTIVYLVRLLSCLELIAGDYAQDLVPRIHTLKLLYLSLEIALIVFSFFAAMLPDDSIFAILDGIVLLAVVVVMIVICVTLFQLRKAIPDEDPRLTGRDPSEDGFGAAEQ